MNPNDFYNSDFNKTPYNDSTQNQPNKFAKVSLILGIVAIATFLYLIPVAFIAALLSIIFGFVSKRSNGRMEGKAIVGIALSSVTLIALAAIVALAFAFLNSMAGVELVNQLISQYADALEIYQEFYH